MNTQIKVILAIVALVVAATVTIWYSLPTPEAGKSRTAQITCRECGTLTKLPWSEVFERGVRNRMAGGWELECPECGTKNLVTDEGEAPPERVTEEQPPPK